MRTWKIPVAALMACVVALVGWSDVEDQPLAEGWRTDFSEALTESSAEKKDLLIYFTLGNWSLDQLDSVERVFNSGSFTEEAKKAFVLVRINYDPSFPDTEQALEAEHEKLLDQFHVQEFPTAVLADSTGRPYALMDQFGDGDTQRCLTELDRLRQVRVARDRALQAASEVEGIRRAVYLDHALSELNEELVRRYYTNELREIIQLDQDNQRGLKHKYQRLELITVEEELVEQHVLQHDSTEDLDTYLTKLDNVLGKLSSGSRFRQPVLMQKAMTLMEGERYDQSLAILDDLIHSPDQTQSQRNDVRLFKVWVLEEAGRIDEAIAVIDRMVAENQDDSEQVIMILMQKADLLYEAQRYLQALQVCDQLLGQSAGSFDIEVVVRTIQVDSLQALGKPQESLALLEQVLGDATQYDTLQLEYCIAYLKQKRVDLLQSTGRKDEAVQQAQELLELFEGDPDCSVEVDWLRLVTKQEGPIPSFAEYVEALSQSTDSTHQDERSEYWIGIYGVPVEPALRQQLSLEDRVGFVIDEVVDGSPAERDGVLLYDVLLKVNGKPLTDLQQLTDAIQKTDGQRPIQMVLIRQGKQIEISTQPELRPRFDGEETPGFNWRDDWGEMSTATPMKAIESPLGVGNINDIAFVMNVERQTRQLISDGELTAGVQLVDDFQPAQLPTIPLAPAVETPLELDELYATKSPAVVALFQVQEDDRGQAHCFLWSSAFAISEDGICVTNYHVLNYCTEPIVAATLDGRVLPVVKVIAADKKNDIVLIQLSEGGFEPLALRSGAPVGTRVSVISHPNGFFYTLSQGIVSRRFRRPATEEEADTSDSGPPDMIPVISITADFGVGSSGGPVLDDSGNVIGMVSETSPVIGHHGEVDQGLVQMMVKVCVPSESILQLIQMVGTTE